MGIDIHGLNFLMYARNKKAFGATLTIGRQGIHINESAVKEAIKTRLDYKKQDYCEGLLTEFFGANAVESIDNNVYEGATHIHNMNQPIPENLTKKFDTVFDGGCLEHIFNVPQALENISLFVKKEGQIIHVLPANNFCGHGFYQFSPELFFSLYSKENGYAETEVYIADLTDNENWYQVKQPSNGQRVELSSPSALYVLVRTVLIGDHFRHSNVMQSDYLYQWNSSIDDKKILATKRAGLKQRLKIPSLYKILFHIYLWYRRHKIRLIHQKNPRLFKLKVRNCIESN